MESTPSPQDQGKDEEIIRILKSWGSLKVDYPPELLDSRRASFLDQVKQLRTAPVKAPLPPTEDFLTSLESFEPLKSEYPPELLAARRASFIAQVEERAAEREATAEPDAEVVQLLTRLKSINSPYPPNLLAFRRAAFRRQLALGGRVSLLDVLYAGWQNLLQFKLKLPSLPTMNSIRPSLVIAALMLAAVLGSLLRVREPVFAPSLAPEQIDQPVPVEPSSTTEVAEAICKPGYVPPLCLAQEFEKSSDLTYAGNGSARPAVAKDTLPGFGGVHKPAYLNDGLYGPGASWVSNSAYSWIKIDLGRPTTINTVTFGRDRLGRFNDRDPGQFVVAVALSDNVYADGNSSKDYMEYTQVYHSELEGFSGLVAGPETVQVDFEPVTARFIKIIFTNEGTAVDEVEVFMIQPPAFESTPTRRPKEDPTSLPATPVPSNTPVPTNTPMPLPTDTLVPTDTATPRPTRTPLPTSTPTDVPTNTPRPTRTPTPEPTDTPRPTNTPLPPTNTPEPTDTPQPTDTPEPPPTDTPEPPPTDTPQPPAILQTLEFIGEP